MTTTPPVEQQLDEIKAAVAATFDQHEPAETRQARWEAAALAAGREVDRNAQRAYMAVADAEQKALARDWAQSVASTDAEIQRLRAELAPYEMLAPQQCPAGKHADWLVDSEYAHACPWCRIEELERPAVEAKRNEIRQSYTDLIAQAEQDRDWHGAFDIQCQLRKREEQWKAEGAARPAAVAAAGDTDGTNA
jgi:hypothetical protein